jgi:hypothetical protein
MRYLRFTAGGVFLLSFTTAAIGADAPAKEASNVTISNPLAAQPLEKLSATIGRPLFSPSRRPPPEPIVQSVEPVAAPPPPPPDLVLSGIVMDGQNARAVVRVGADKRIVHAQIGDNIDGWRVSQIDGRTLVLSLDGRSVTFTLFNRQVDQGNYGAASNASGGSAGPPQPLQMQRQDSPPEGQGTGNQRRRRRMGE